MDVIHPEFVETYEEIAKLDPDLFRRRLALSAVMVDLVCSGNPKATVFAALEEAEAVLDHRDIFEIGELVKAAARAALIGSACGSGSWQTAPEFILKNEYLELDPPDEEIIDSVLRQLMDDLEDGFKK